MFIFERFLKNYDPANLSKLPGTSILVGAQAGMNCSIRSELATGDGADRSFDAIASKNWSRVLKNDIRRHGFQTSARGRQIDICVCHLCVKIRAFTLPFGYGQRMDDWKDSIRATLKDQVDAKAARESRQQDEATAEDRRLIENARFLKDVIRPAMEDIKKELEANGLRGIISESPQEITLAVLENGERRFTYGISGSCQACVRASGASASVGAIPMSGPAPTGDDIKRHFGAEFRSIFSRKRQH